MRYYLAGEGDAYTYETTEAMGPPVPEDVAKTLYSQQDLLNLVYASGYKPTSAEKTALFTPQKATIEREYGFWDPRTGKTTTWTESGGGVASKVDWTKLAEMVGKTGETMTDVWARRSQLQSQLEAQAKLKKQQPLATPAVTKPEIPAWELYAASNKGMLALIAVAGIAVVGVTVWAMSRRRR